MSRNRPVVAIDGPAGAGKSTVTRLVAEALGYTRVDTGALYRAVAWLGTKRGADLSQPFEMGAIASELAQPAAIELSTSGQAVGVKVLGEDVSEAIRDQVMGLGASRVSQLPPVREALLEIQRELGRSGGVVLEGRDIGSVVFPDAEAKFYLTASAEVRAGRRQQELAQKGDDRPLEEVVAEVNERDRRDMERAIAPLVQADDAEVVDSSQLGIDEVVAAMVARIREIESRLEGSE